MCPHYCRDQNHTSLLERFPDLRISSIKGRILYRLFLKSGNDNKDSRILTKCAECEIRLYNIIFTHCPCCGSSTRDRDVYQKRLVMKAERKKSATITETITLPNGIEIVKVVRA